jgi:hypothetical protein
MRLLLPLAPPGMSALPESSSYLHRATRGHVSVPLYDEHSSASSSMFRTASSDGISGADTSVERARVTMQLRPQPLSGTAVTRNGISDVDRSVGALRSRVMSMSTARVGGVDDAPQIAVADAVDSQQAAFGVPRVRIFEFSSRDAGESRRRHRHRRQQRSALAAAAAPSVDLFSNSERDSGSASSHAVADDLDDVENVTHSNVFASTRSGGSPRSVSRLMHANSVLRVPLPSARRALDSSRVTEQQSNSVSVSAGGTRRLPRLASRMHDAIGVGTDFYLQLLASAADRNQIALSLADSVWLLRWDRMTPVALGRVGGSVVGSVAFAKGNEPRLAVGTSSGIHLFDSEVGQRTGTLLAGMYASSRAFASLSWHGAHLLAAGMQDGRIQLLDVRAPAAVGARALMLQQHRGIVCGLDFSASALLASGGNDGLLCIWDQRSTAPVVVFEQVSCRVDVRF